MSSQKSALKMHVRQGDTVVVLSGRNKGKTGKILAVSPKEGKVIVENANIVSKHLKPRRQGEAGGIIQAEAAIYSSKVQIICPKCGKPTRIGHAVVGEGEKRHKVRVCKRTGCGASF